MGEGLSSGEVPSGHGQRSWADTFADKARSGQPLDGSSFLTIALNFPEEALEGLGRVCDELGVSPQTVEDVAEIFEFKTDRQREEFIRRLSAVAQDP